MGVVGSETAYAASIVAAVGVDSPKVREKRLRLKSEGLPSVRQLLVIYVQSLSARSRMANLKSSSSLSFSHDH